MPAQRKEFNAEEVYKLARLGCTNQDIGDFFGVSDELIRIRFLDILALGRADQKTSLRRLQWKSAKSGNVAMLIHLGKQYLGQSDKQSFDFSGMSDAELIARASGVAGRGGSPEADDRPEADADPDISRVRE